MSAGPSPTAMRATTRFLDGEIRNTRAPWSSATHTEPAPIQMLYAAVAPRGIRRITRARAGSTRYSVDAESRAQIEPSPAVTAITGPSSATAAVRLPLGRASRTSRDSSLHATQALSPLSASVIVGQYGPAPAHARTDAAAGMLPCPAPPASGTPTKSIAPITDATNLIEPPP